MWDLLVQQGLQKALACKTNKPTTITNEEWEDLNEKALSTICLCLAYDTTSGLWSNMEILYMTKSLMRKIYLKRHLYSLVCG
jgi:hypothetical protein